MKGINMGYAKHVGRVGALAVALGIGAAVATTPGTACATEGETENTGVETSSDPGTTSDPATTDPSTAQRPGDLIRRNLERATDDLRDGIRTAVTGVVRSSGGAITSTHRNGSNASNGNVPSVIVEDEEEQLDNPESKDEQKSTTKTVGSFTAPRWRARQAQIDPKPAPKPVAKAIDDIEDVVQQSINAVTGQQPQTGSTDIQRNAISTFDAPATEDVQEVRPRFVAPTDIMTNVLNAALAPFLNPTPGEPAPQNPILWAVLGWVRRQVQDTPFGKVVLNRPPQIDPVATQVVDNRDGTFTITPSAADPDGDDLTYTVTGSGADEGTLTDNGDGTFTYEVNDPSTWDESDTVTLTVSDEADYPHIHGLLGILSPGGGHTDSHTVTIAPEDGSLPEPVNVPLPPTERQNEPGVYDTVIQYDPETVTNVSAATGGDAPKYYRVVSESYDPVTGKYTAVLEATQAGMIRQGLGLDTEDFLKLQVTQGSSVQTFALRSADFSTLAEDPPDEALALPTPPAAHLAIDDPAIEVGENPAGVVVTDNFAYVINQGAGTVTVIDINDNSFEKTIEVGETPTFGTLSGDRLYVVNATDGSISVIDTVSNDLVDANPGNEPGTIDAIEVAPFIASPAASPDGTRLYVTNLQTGALYVVNIDPAHEGTATHYTVIDTIQVAPPPTQQEQYVLNGGIAFNEDGSRLYVTRQHGQVVNDQQVFGSDIVVINTDPTDIANYNTVVDLDTSDADVDTIQMDGLLAGFTASRDGKLYVSALDATQLNQQNPFQTPGRIALVGIDPNDPSYHQVIDTDTTDTDVDSVAVGKFPLQFALSPDGSLAYVVNNGDGTVMVLDTATNTVIDEFTFNPDPGQSFNLVGISPDGNKLYVTNYGDGTAMALSIEEGPAPDETSVV